MQPQGITLPPPDVMISMLTPEDIEHVTNRLNDAINRYPERLPADLIRPVTSYFKDGKWYLDRLGHEPIDMNRPAMDYVRDIMKPRLKAEHLARQRKMILLCRDKMTDDEFVEWAKETLPLLVPSAT